MDIALATWKRLLSDDHAALRDRAAMAEPTDVAAVAALRKLASPELVRAALALSEARRKAATKFPDRAATLLADPEGVEVASSLATARHKAARWAQLGQANRVVDLCCGIGGDAIALTEAGLDVLGIDRDPVRAWMASRNADCETAVADAADVDVSGGLVHLDPARRSSAGRAWRLADYQPGPTVIGRCVTAARAAAVKLGPGVDVDALPFAGEIEMISESGRLVQAVLWTGDLRRGERSATVLPHGATLTGAPSDAPAGDWANYIHAVDPAVERARLIGALAASFDLVMPHPQLGLLSGDARIDTPFATGFELIERMAWRPKRVEAALRAMDAGAVEIKTRGGAVDPDAWQKRLSGEGDQRLTVFVQIGRAHV